MNTHINDLYAFGKILQFPDNSILVRTILSFDQKDQTNAQFYTVKDNDSLDNIAYKYYSKYTEKSELLWYVIADANNIYNPLDLSKYVGKEIMIPNFFELQLKLK